MSEEFIEYIFPCNECLVQAACKDTAWIRKKSNINHRRPSLSLPIFKDKSYHKGLLECIMNLQKRVMDKVSKTESHVDYKEYKQKVDNLPMEYVQLLISMSDILCHMVNSTSWREGELFEFDRIELKRRLTHLERWL